MFPPFRRFKRRCGSRSPGDSDADSDADSGGGSSSANEYAEGLGCADRRRCREQSGSQYEFDNHPREEYFEQPKSHPDARADDADFDDVDLRRPAKRRAAGAVPGRALSTRLADLENVEANCGNNGPSDRKSRILHRLASPAGHGLSQVGAGPGRGMAGGREPCVPRAPQARPAQAQPAQPSGSSARPPAADLGRLKHCCATLARIRIVAEARPAAPQEIAMVVEVLKLLGNAHVDAAALKLTGLGLELNQAAWRKHRTAEIASRSGALVTAWRQAVRAPRPR